MYSKFTPTDGIGKPANDSQLSLTTITEILTQILTTFLLVFPLIMYLLFVQSVIKKQEIYGVQRQKHDKC